MKKFGIRFYLGVFFVILYSSYVIFTAWLGDDAQITLRAVLNFVHGYGPVHNVGERV